MKQQLFKSILITTSVVLATVTMQSCLGDSENTYELNNKLACISQKSNITYAVEETGTYFTFSTISNYAIGDCMLMSVKLNGDDVSGNIFNAETATVQRTFSKKNGSQVTLQYGKQENITDPEIYPSSFNTGVRIGYPEVRQLFTFNAAGDNENTSTKYLASLYYDKDAQKEPSSSGNDTIAVSDNHIIIDVRFYNMANSSNGLGTNNKNFVADLSSILINYNANYSSAYQNSNGYTFVYAKFRYRVTNSDGKIVEKYLGDWTSNPIYFPKAS